MQFTSCLHQDEGASKVHTVGGNHHRRGCPTMERQSGSENAAIPTVPTSSWAYGKAGDVITGTAKILSAFLDQPLPASSGLPDSACEPDNWSPNKTPFLPHQDSTHNHPAAPHHESNVLLIFGMMWWTVPSKADKGQDTTRCRWATQEGIGIQTISSNGSPGLFSPVARCGVNTPLINSIRMNITKPSEMPLVALSQINFCPF